MKMTVLGMVVLVLAAPAMAATDVNLVLIDEGCGIVAIYYDARSAPNLPRAFALDITADSDAYIADITDYHTGQSSAGSKGYGIFPGSIDINEAGEVNDVGTPVADACDLPSDTLPGLGTSYGITIEMGSLYVGAANAPDPCGLLCRVYVTSDCNLTVAENVGRGKVVLEGPTQATTNLPQTVPVFGCYPYTISGNVSSGAAPIKNLAGVVMTGLPSAPVTNASGNYWEMVLPGWEGAVTPTKAQWSIPSKIYLPVHADAFNEDYTATATECLASCDVGYAYWVTHGQPDCWCCRRQCHGDADCLSLLGRPVAIADNNLLKAAFGLLDAQLDLIPNGICADFNHDATFGRRVTIADNNILKLYFGLTEASVPLCSAQCINEWTD